MVFTTDNSQTSDEGQTQQEQTGGTEQQSSFVDQLVQAKGDNWRDPEVLAKGKLEADTYISNLETQLKELREELERKDYTDSVMSQAKDKASVSTADKTSSPNKDDKGTGENGNTSQELSDDKLKSLVEQTLHQREQETKVKNNLAQVDAQLNQTFGTDAAEVVQKKAQELGMSMERIKDIAQESPAAFFALIGEGNKKTQSPMVQGSVRTESINTGSTERTFDYYQKLRRENRNLYYTPKVQQQMMEDKARLGDRFGA